MHFSTKWLIFSFGGGAVIAAILLLFPSALPDNLPAPLDLIATVVLWPVPVCEFLVGPGATIGSSSQHLHEGTPVNIVVAVLGVGLSWVFYSSVVLFATCYWNRRQLSDREPTKSNI